MLSKHLKGRRSLGTHCVHEVNGDATHSTQKTCPQDIEQGVLLSRPKGSRQTSQDEVGPAINMSGRAKGRGSTQPREGKAPEKGKAQPKKY